MGAQGKETDKREDKERERERCNLSPIDWLYL